MATAEVTSGNLPATYSFIYSFLSQHAHTKAAAAVKKAAKDIVELDEPILEGPTLDEIIGEWKDQKIAAAAAAVAAVTPAAEASSSSDSSSDSESDSESDSSSSSSSSSSSASASSSSGSSAAAVVQPAKESTKAIKEKKTNGNKAAQAEGSNSSSSSDSDSDSDVAPTVPLATSTKTGKARKPVTPPSSDSDSDAAPAVTALVSKKKKRASSTPPPATKTPAVVEVITTKKRRVSPSGAAIVTETATIVREEMERPNGKSVRKTNVPFQRVKDTGITFKDERLQDMRYDVKGGTENDYGAKASADLIVTRGAGFRKEKNKKKKGSYRGGEITMQSHSIKFTD